MAQAFQSGAFDPGAFEVGNAAATAQGQSGSASGAITISGSASTAQAQTESISASLTFTASVSTSQGRQSSAATAAQTFSGTINTAQARQSASATGALTFSATVSTAQRQAGSASGEYVFRSEAFDGGAFYDGAFDVRLANVAATSQGSQSSSASASVANPVTGTNSTAQTQTGSVTARLTLNATASTTQVQAGSASGALTFSATASTSQAQSSSVSAAQTISGSASTSQVQTGSAVDAVVITGTAETSQIQTSDIDAQLQRGTDGGSGNEHTPNNRRKQLIEAAQDIEAAIAASSNPKRLQAVAKATKRVKAYADDEFAQTADVFDLSRILQMRQMELRQEVSRLGEQSRQTADFALILERFSVFVNHLQEDEDDCLVLLLSEA